MGGSKLPDMEKKVRKKKKNNQIRGQNGTRKWLVEVLSSHVVLSKTLYLTVPNRKGITLNISLELFSP